MENLKNDIKTKQFHSIYLLCGEEDYLKRAYKQQLKQAIVENDSMNYNYFTEKNFELHDLISICDTMPFFEEHRLVVVEDSGFFKSAQEELTKYLDQIPESTILVFVESQVDKRLALYKKVKAKGYVCELKTPGEQELLKWAFGFIKRDGKKIKEDTLKLFLKMVGDDMETISNELEKLLCYCMEQEVIREEDVLEICIKQIDVRIFDLFDAIACGNQKKTLDIYYELVENKEPLMRILFMLGRQFQQLAMVRQLDQKGYSPKNMVTPVGVKSEWVIKQLLRQAKVFSFQQLKGAVKDCVEQEELVKTGGLDEKIAVESILIKYSSIAREKRNS